ITSTAGHNCNVWEILRNNFWANANHIWFPGPDQAPLGAIIMHNVFGSEWAGMKCQLGANAAWNIISQNFLGGAYSWADGYRAGEPTTQWYGNYADVDGGITRIAPA
ncbi:unnamed protein product, partial [marine sediment metagenome]